MRCLVKSDDWLADIPSAKCFSNSSESPAGISFFVLPVGIMFIDAILHKRKAPMTIISAYSFGMGATSLRLLYNITENHTTFPKGASSTSGYAELALFGDTC